MVISRTGSVQQSSARCASLALQTAQAAGLYLGSVTRSAGLLGMYSQMTACFKALLSNAWVFSMTERETVASVFLCPLRITAGLS